MEGYYSRSPIDNATKFFQDEIFVIPAATGFDKSKRRDLQMLPQTFRGSHYGYLAFLLWLIFSQSSLI
jgi:hypothetical protein